MINVEYFFSGQHYIGSDMSDVAAREDATEFFISCPNWAGTDGYIMRVDSLGDVSGYKSVTGHPFRLTAVPGGAPPHLYVLSNTGDGTGLVTVLHVDTFSLVAEIPVAGYPWDMVIHGDHLLVLAAD